MTIEERVLAELASGPKTLNYLTEKCAPPLRGEAARRSMGVGSILAIMVSRGDIAVREWVIDKGRFVPIYYLRRRPRWRPCTWPSGPSSGASPGASSRTSSPT